MARLSQAEADAYANQGYVVPDYRLPAVSSWLPALNAAWQDPADILSKE